MIQILEFVNDNLTDGNRILEDFRIHLKIKKEGKMNALVNTLRIIAMDNEIQSRSVLIPSGTNQNAFNEGQHNLGELLYYLADMLEE